MPRKTSPDIRGKIEEYVKDWQHKLQLDRWQIKLKWEVLEDAVGETTPDDMYDYAVMKFNDLDLATRSDDYIEKTVIHELLHLHDRDRKMMFNEIEGNLSADVYRLYERVIYQQTEAFVDRMASCLYDLAHKGEENA